jgi:hypothetical protein
MKLSDYYDSMNYNLKDLEFFIIDKFLETKP